MEYSLINGYWSLWEDLAAREPVDVVKLISPEHANVPRCLWRWGIQEAVDTSLCELAFQPATTEHGTTRQAVCSIGQAKGQSVEPGLVYTAVCMHPRTLSS